jgi:hypothetical protein
MENKQNYEMIINNQKVFEFYDNNSALNFEQVNLLCIGLFENILQDANSSMNKSITNQILSSCLENNHKLDEITTELNKNMIIINGNIEKLKSDLILKFFDIKKDYIEEVKTIININGNEKVDKINNQLRENTNIFKELIEKGNSQLLDKTALLNHSLVNDITSKIDKLNSTNATDITNKIERFDDKMNIILNKINTETIEKINSLVNLSNGSIVDKIQSMLNTIIPINNDKINKQIQDEINKFHLIITDETKILTELTSNHELTDFIKIYNEKTQLESLNSRNLVLKQDIILSELSNILNKNNTLHLESFVNNFDIKFNSLLLQIQQPIIEATTKQQTTQDKMYSSLEVFLDRYRNNSSSKGKYAELHLQKILEENIDNAEIIDKSKTDHSCDLLLKRTNKCNILFENKAYTHKVPTPEVDKFKNDCMGLKTHGIILSQFSKITLKENNQIEIIEDKNNKYILVYLTDVKDEYYKIEIAINIIDCLSKTLKSHDNSTDEINDYTISKELLNEINEDFKILMSKKQTIILLVKDFQKKITLSLDELEFPSLEKYIKTSLSLPTDENCNITCNKCKKFVAKSKSSLASHQKGKECIRIYNEINNIQENLDDKISTDSAEENEIIGNIDIPVIDSNPFNNNISKTKNTKEKSKPKR